MVLSATYNIDGKKMTVDAEEFRAVLRRLD